MALNVNIVSFFDPKGINNARKSFSALTDSNVSSAKKQAIAMKLVGGAFAAAGVAASAFAVKLARDGVRAALEDEKSLTMLNKTLTNLGVGFQSSAVDDFVNKLQFSTGVADDQLRPALNRLVLATGSVTEAQDMLSLALDVSSGTGKDLESVSVALAKAAGGQYTALQRLGVGLDKSILETKDLDLITKTLGDRFSGQASAAANTYAGRLQILTLGAEEAKEAIGYGLLDAAETVAKALGYNAGGLAQSLADTGEEIGNSIRELGYITAGLIKFTDEATNANDESSLFSRSIDAIGDSALKTNPKLQVLITALQLIGLYGRETTVGQTPDQIRDLARGQQAMRAMERAQSDARVAAQEAAEQAQKDAEAAAAEAQRAAEAEAKSLAGRLERLGKVSKDFAKTMAGANPQTVQGSLDNAKKSLEDMRVLVSKTSYVTDDITENFTELSSVVSNNLTSAFDVAKNQLESAKSAFNDFKNSIIGSITGTINFASAVEETDFLTGLEKQANTAIDFSTKVGKLLEMGLSERALQQVLNAGAETGIKIADEIIAGGSTVVAKVNTLLNSVQSVAEQVGLNGAKLFYDAGVTQGEALVQGILDAMASAASTIAGFVASLPSGSLPSTPSASTAGSGAIPKPKPSPTPAPTFAEKVIKAAGGASSTAASRSYTAMAASMGKIRLAKGGIVTSPTNALIGEAGPEAVIPLTGSNSGSLSPTYNIVVNAGIGTNGAQVGQQIVEAIKKFERTSGQVFARA
jgi:hypothetical protein